MQKRGQITTFIIIGIMILAIVALFLFLRQDASPIEKQRVPSEVGPVSGFVENCLQRIGEEGIITNSLRGGYYKNFDSQKVQLPGLNFVPVYFNGFSIFVPSDEKLRQELELYVKDNLNKCVNNFESLAAFSVEIQGDVSISRMIIGDEKVSIQYNYPLLVDGETIIDSFVTEHNLRLGKVMGEVRTLVAQNQLMPDMLCLSCYIDSGVGNGLTFDTIELGEFVIIIVNDETTRPALNFAYALKLVSPIEEESMLGEIVEGPESI